PRGGNALRRDLGATRHGLSRHGAGRRGATRRGAGESAGQEEADEGRGGDTEPGATEEAWQGQVVAPEHRPRGGGQMPSRSSESPLGGIPDAFVGLLRAQAEWGQEFFEAVTGTRVPGLDELRSAWERSLPKPVCHVPPPCWMPLSLGEVSSHVNECGRACIR